MKHRHASDSLLIFDWRRHDVSGVWLWLFLGLTFLGLAALFVLFRIVTPETPAVVARPQQMILLDPAVPAERALIHRAMDRSFTLIPNESVAVSQIPSVLLPAFRPASRGFQAALRSEDPSTATSAAAGPLGVMQFEDVLPPVPRPASPPAVAPQPVPKLRMVVSGRALLQPAGLEGILLLDPERVRFRVGVDRQGRAQLALPLTASEDEDTTARLHQAVTASRFQPAGPDAAELEWAEVTFAWEVEKPAAP